MNEKVIEELESRICDLPGHETLGIFGKEAEGPLMTAGDLQTIFADLTLIKKALADLVETVTEIAPGTPSGICRDSSPYGQKLYKTLHAAKSALADGPRS